MSQNENSAPGGSGDAVDCKASTRCNQHIPASVVNKDPPTFVEWLTTYIVTASSWGRRGSASRCADLSRLTIDLVQYLAGNNKLIHANAVDDIYRCIAEHCGWRNDYRPFIELI